MPEFNLYLDSGAHSLYNHMIKKKGQTYADVVGSNAYSYCDTQKFADYYDGYVRFVKKYGHLFKWYVNLDVIFNPERTLEIQRSMENEGLSPMPVFHYGEDFKHLRWMMDNYEYIGIGGLGQHVRKSEFITHADKVFKMLCDGGKTPRWKTHGFAITSFDLLQRYPFTTVDSSSWVQFSIFGMVLFPHPTFGFTQKPLEVCFSTRSDFKEVDAEAVHYDNMPPSTQRRIREYLADKGYGIGKSFFVDVPSYHKCWGYELWDGPEAEPELPKENGLRAKSLSKKKELKPGHRRLEKKVISGVCNNHALRDQLNYIYYMDLQASLPHGTEIIMGGNFDLMTSPRREARMKDLITGLGFPYNRMGSYYFQDRDDLRRLDILMEMKIEEQEGQKNNEGKG